MSCSRRKSLPPHDWQATPSGTKSASSRSYHASAPCCSNTTAARSTTSASSIASPHAVHCSAGMGTPQERCREMHQSGRVASMPRMRSSPHAGNHSTPATASSARSRSEPASIRMNHWAVARKMTGLWQRQQCG